MWLYMTVNFSYMEGQWRVLFVRKLTTIYAFHNGPGCLSNGSLFWCKVLVKLVLLVVEYNSHNRTICVSDNSLVNFIVSAAVLPKTGILKEITLDTAEKNVIYRHSKDNIIQIYFFSICEVCAWLGRWLVGKSVLETFAVLIYIIIIFVFMTSKNWICVDFTICTQILSHRFTNPAGSSHGPHPKNDAPILKKIIKQFHAPLYLNYFYFLWSIKYSYH